MDYILMVDLMFPACLKVAIHYYGRLAAKQGWRFDSTYDHKDATGDPIPFVFTIGSGKVS
jgi:FKBP-type peptidyl-prolyl cis-trans isomerase